MDPATIAKAGGSIVAIVLLVMIGIAIFRRMGGEVRGKRGNRLGVVEFQEVDKLRHLVLVRRDNSEHLLMIGGPQDIVIETNIGETENRPAGVRRMPPPEPSRGPGNFEEFGEHSEESLPSLGPPGPRPRR